MSQLNKEWKIYLIEFISVFIAVISAFALNNWNDNRKEQNAEEKILEEISNGLIKDLDDININIKGHNMGLRSIDFWRAIINGQSPPVDSLEGNYISLTRDFISIQNISGYETLKSRGLELIKDDSLRMKIISLYEYDYSILKKMEEEYAEMQFQDNYFHEINQHLAPHFQFNETGWIEDMNLPLELNKKEKRLLLSYLWKIRVNRNYILPIYKEVKGNVKELRADIKTLLDQ